MISSHGLIILLRIVCMKHVEDFWSELWSRFIVTMLYYLWLWGKGHAVNWPDVWYRLLYEKALNNQVFNIVVCETCRSFPNSVILHLCFISSLWKWIYSLLTFILLFSNVSMNRYTGTEEQTSTHFKVCFFVYVVVFPLISGGVEQ